jgi:hypothetical protein
MMGRRLVIPRSHKRLQKEKPDRKVGLPYFIEAERGETLCVSRSTCK